MEVVIEIKSQGVHKLCVTTHHLRLMYPWAPGTPVGFFTPVAKKEDVRAKECPHYIMDVLVNAWKILLREATPVHLSPKTGLAGCSIASLCT